MNTFVNQAKAVAASVWMHSFAARGQFASLKDRTAILQPDSIPADVCEDLVRRIESLADASDHPRVWHDPEGSDTRIVGFERDIGDVIEHFNVHDSIKAVDDYVGIRTKSWLLMANRVVPKPNNKGSGGGLHRDSPFSHQVKCIWYLSDVTEDTGPFQYVPGSHVNLYKARDIYPLGQTRFDVVREELVEVHAKAGSLLICDTKCIHGGKPIKSGARYAVTLYTFPKADGAARMYRALGMDESFGDAAKAA
jgi:hypothetical protein